MRFVAFVALFAY